MFVLQVQKNIERKSRHQCSNIERGEAGEGFLLRVARDFLAGIVFLIYAGNFDGPFSSLSRDRFSKRHN